MHALWKTLTALAALAVAGEAAARSNCAERIPGELYPWQSRDIIPGDKWANLLLDVDVTGKATKCRVGKNNMDSEARLFTCQAVMEDWRGPPATDAGTKLRTIDYFMVLKGPRRRQIEETARKKFFREHPDERPGCYPF